jgi:hypothetical protein
MDDIRGYINPFPPGALTEAGQRGLMPREAELYVEDRKGRQIDALIASVRKGTTVHVAELYLLAPAVFRPQKRRRILGERIEAIERRGGLIYEARTGDNSRPRHLPRMMLRAYEQIATSGRARKHNRTGRPPTWVLTTAERNFVELEWRSRRHRNDEERTLAIQQRLGKKISRHWLRLTFGSPHKSD